MQALYRLYRPQKFSELVGQEQVSGALLKGLEKGIVSHAFLFVGPRGTGKTSTARILAKALNCLHYPDEKWGEPDNSCASCLSINEGRYLDLIEIDAASNRGIDEIRDLREKIKLAPTQGKFKIYIIDEVHMLTTEAFNALLKTLEEPPPHAKFVLCTTDPQKIPATIKSRCQVYEFKIPTLKEIINVLERVAKQDPSWEKIKEEKEEVFQKIAKKARGAYRDALVLLEKYLVSGVVDQEIQVSDLAWDYYQGETKEALEKINQALLVGINPKVIAESLIDWNRKALLIHLGMQTDIQKEVGEEEWKNLESYVGKTTPVKIKELLAYLTSSLEEFRYTPIPQLPLELAIVANDQSLTNGDSAIETVDSKETTEPKIAVKEKASDQKEGQATGPVAVKIEKSDNDTASLSSEEANQTTIDIKETNELTSIKEQWLDLLRILRPINHSLEALLRSSEPVNYQDGALTLRFFYRFHKERVEDPKNKKVVEKVFRDGTGLPIHLKLILSDSPRPIKAREASQKEVVNVKIVDDKDIPEAALDMFTN